MKELIGKLKDRGVVLTPQRIAVIEFLKKSCSHPTVDDIYRAIHKKYPTMSMATVYSTLEKLKEMGEIQELSIRSSKACFDSNPRPHHHLLCRECDKIFDIEVECPIRKKGWLGKYKIEGVQAYFYGLCPDCLKLENNLSDRERG
jgi:Fur family peroxide stress response transcriptional regulator